jgi:1-acyl-sn-glycerol-3-phosphate acyltransferase
MQTSLIAYLPFTQKLARAILNLAGWRVDTIYPSEKKYVVVGAHHTSNWDLPVALLFSMATGIKFNFIAKDEAFRWPFAGWMRWLGGIPVNRRARTHFVDQIAEEFRARENLIIVITPEGTRKKTEYWKTGFYYIALAAKVPVALGYLDYPHKRVGIGKMITLVGDFEADLAVIREFYADKMGKYPQDHGEICIRPSESENRP